MGFIFRKMRGWIMPERTPGTGAGVGMPENAVRRPPQTIARLLVPSQVLRQTITGIALGGGREMLAYWVGCAIENDDRGRTRAAVTTVAFPKIASDYDHFELIEGQMGLITSWCADHGLWVLAQVHSHPTDEDHSHADETWAASHRSGFLSIVFPFFAQHSTLRDPHWRVFESTSDGEWIQIDPAERFEVVPDVWLPST